MVYCDHQVLFVICCDHQVVIFSFAWGLWLSLLCRGDCACCLALSLIPLCVEVIVFWLCAHPSCVEVIEFWLCALPLV